MERTKAGVIVAMRQCQSQSKFIAFCQMSFSESGIHPSSLRVHYIHWDHVGSKKYLGNGIYYHADYHDMLQVLRQEVNLSNPTCARDEDLKLPIQVQNWVLCLPKKYLKTIIFDKRAFLSRNFFNKKIHRKIQNIKSNKNKRRKSPSRTETLVPLTTGSLTLCSVCSRMFGSKGNNNSNDDSSLPP